MRRLFFTLTALLVAAPLAFAQSPPAEQIPYQGYLTDSGGPLTATLDVTFTLGDGSTTWSETAAVSVEEGVFTHYLGSVEAITGIDFGANVELTLTIDPAGANETVGPFPLGAVPVAYEALNGGGFALPFSGTTNTSDAAFQLSNEGGIGIAVTQTGGRGISISNTGGSGLRIASPGDTDGDGIPDQSVSGISIIGGNPGIGLENSETGIAMGFVAGDGLSISLADNDGVSITRAGGSGVEIGSTGDSGIFVGLTGDSDGDGIPDNSGAGFSVSQSGGPGFRVQNAGTEGLRVQEAGTDGVYVRQTAGRGLRIGVTGDTDSDGIPDDDFAPGILVENAGGNGLRVESAGQAGVFVLDARNGGVFGGRFSGIRAIGDLDDDGIGQAGNFNGDVFVDGTFTATSKSFLIDHPSAPAERTLRHASVESAERLVTYSGTVTLDGSGAATIALPAYVEDLAADFRYGLTPIGAAMPDLHIAAEVAGDRFRIAGGAPGLKVSWRLDGVRVDAWARQNPLVVEEDKRPEDRGYYLSPEAFGQDRFEGINIREHWAERQAMIEEAEAERERRAQQDAEAEAERERRAQQRAEAERQRELSRPAPPRFDQRRN